MSHRINFIQKEKHLIQNIVYFMSEISASLVLFEEHSKFITIKGQQMRHMAVVPSKSSHHDEAENPVTTLLNQKGHLIQFLLLAGVFELANTLFLPSSVMQILETTSQNIKNIVTAQKPVVWSAQKKELDFIYKQILDASDDLKIKATHSRNLRSIEMLKQIFKVFIPEDTSKIEPGNLAKLLGSSIIQYLFAYAFLKRVGKSFENVKSSVRHDSTQLSLERIYEAVNLYKKCNKKAVFIFLSKFRLVEQFQILEEIKGFLQNESEDQYGAVKLIPFAELLNDKQILQNLDKNDLKKLTIKIQYKIASTLLLRPTANPDQNLEAEKVKIMKTGFEVIH